MRVSCLTDFLILLEWKYINGWKCSYDYKMGRIINSLKLIVSGWLLYIIRRLLYLAICFMRSTYIYHVHFTRLWKSLKLIPFQISDSTKVCSEHFRQFDYRKTLTGKRVLNKGPVPSLFKWTKPSPKSERKTRLHRRSHTDVKAAEATGKLYISLN